MNSLHGAMKPPMLTASASNPRYTLHAMPAVLQLTVQRQHESMEMGNNAATVLDLALNS